MNGDSPPPLTVDQRYEDSPKLAVGPGYFACPLCRRTVDRGGRAEGFRKAGMFRHVWSCWEKCLAAQGLKVGDWSDEHNGYRIVSDNQEPQ